MIAVRPREMDVESRVRYRKGVAQQRLRKGEEKQLGLPLRETGVGVKGKAELWG